MTPVVTASSFPQIKECLKMGRYVTLPSNQASLVFRHAATEYPRQCCGVLLGDADEIAYIHEMANCAAGPNEYDIDTEELAAIKQKAHKAHIDLVGIYHSLGENIGVLSEEDRRYLSSHPQQYILIITQIDKARPALTLYGMENSQIRELALIIQ